MSTLAQVHEVSKLIAMTGNVVVRNQAYKRARHSDDEAREYGRLDKSIKDMAESAEHCLKRVVTPAIQFERGVTAAKQKKARDSHEMNHGSLGLADWLAGFDSVKQTKVEP